MTFDYHEPRSLPEALELLDRYGEDAHLMAGGTATVLLMRQGLLRPGHVLAMRRIDELRGIARRPDGGLRIGAMTTHRAVERSADAFAYSPALTDAFASVATIRIRNQATVGGNLAHADPAQDPPPMLAALGATVTVRSTQEERSLPVEELAVDHFTTSLAHNEIITEVILPPLEPGTRETYLKFLPRTADDYATVSVAAILRFAADRRIAETRIVLGAVGPTPMRARHVEDALRGQPTARIRDAVDLVRDEIDPVDDLRGSAAYKREMARVWTGRALAQVTR
ncbi:MAG TPA: xanthine dehydrogenase family protein subunit M [Candidatus Limnocylindria bacterium]|nr:xanthine dehydrogenase family protein subunit M [Candidatus Limnocylindria bacterium]